MRGLGARAAATLSLVASMAGCRPDLRDDGFLQQIAHRCATAAGCDQTLKEAQARVAHCNESANPTEACVAARLDLDSVERLRKRYVDEAAVRESTARPPEASAGPGAEVTPAQAEDPRAIHAAVLRTALADCKATTKLAKCAAEGSSPEEKAACEAECTKFGVERSEALFLTQLRECALAAESDPKATRCAADGRPWAPTTRLEECSVRCAALAAKLRSYASARTKCCDGTRSPTCTNGDHRTDCCEDHGGICPEPRPPVE